MKKVYQKPQIYFENFSLSTSVAGDCRFLTDLQAEGGCGYLLSATDEIVFVSNLTGCSDITAPEGEYLTICYDVPSVENDVFNS